MLGNLLCRAVNVLLAAAALVLLTPVSLVIALLIKLDSAGPVIFRQTRVGLDRRSNLGDSEVGGRRAKDLGGRLFTIYKFRTMKVGAERESGAVWARPDDPRVTRVGKVLRASRLDEIPQFLNVLRGDMAIVGPRPERPHFVRELRRKIERYRQRQRVRPGITGWAQVNKGYDQSLEDVHRKVQYDLEYVRHRSFWFDVKIMFMTVPVMMKPSGAFRSEGATPPATERGGGLVDPRRVASGIPDL